MSTGIRLRGIRKAFTGRVVLDGIDLELAPGQLCTLRGANGSGKSTLIRCTVGDTLPDEGTVELGGHPLATDPVGARRALRYLPQTLVPTAGLTGDDVVALYRDLYGGSAAEEARAGAESDPLPLDALVTTYSLGMLRRLFVRALRAGTPKAVVLDEPLAGLDPDGAQEVVHAIEHWLANGAAVLAAVHDHTRSALAKFDPTELVLG